MCTSLEKNANGSTLFTDCLLYTSSPLAAEGVGSYWPFATGLRVKQANLLMEQILSCTSTRYVLIPNQNIGIYQVGFAPEWISREYLARRGGVNMRMDLSLIHIFSHEGWKRLASPRLFRHAQDGALSYDPAAARN